MKSEKFLIGMASVIIVLLLILIGMQLSFRHRSMMPPDMEKSFLKMLDEIGVTAEQKSKLLAEQQVHKDKMEALFEKIHQKREALKTELSKETLNRDVIKQKHDELKQALLEREDYHLKMILSLADILTAKQRLKMQEKMEKMHKPMGPMPPGMRPH